MRKRDLEKWVAHDISEMINYSLRYFLSFDAAFFILKVFPTRGLIQLPALCSKQSDLMVT